VPRADHRSFVERLWYGDDGVARVARLALAPAAAAYRGVSSLRGALYDRGVLRSHELPIPAVSVGNLTVGGTGKTPVAAWVASELVSRGARASVVLRGYGDDEPAVHARLNPEAIVVANPDRVAGVELAAARGADVAVLDDAFQHRRARRAADIVLLSADLWPAHVRLLPAGPFREPLGALSRASLALVTRKAATPEAAAVVERAIGEAAPGLSVARAHLAPDALVDVRDGTRTALAELRGRKVLAICGVGDPAAFRAQLAAAGGDVVVRAFPDHHPFSDAEIASLAAEARGVTRAGGLVVCTLKDAVKLSSRWPSGTAALSYVSQHVILESGHEALDRLLTSVLHARRSGASAPGRHTRI